MKKQSNWSLLGYIAGAGFSLFSGVRYFWLYPDTDRAIVYVLIGGIICGLAWLYNKQLQHQNTIDAMEEYLVDVREHK